MTYEYGSLYEHIDMDFNPPVIQTLGYRREFTAPGEVAIHWPDPSAYTFPHTDGTALVHGGMLATLADTAMGHAAMTLIDLGQTFLTGDLRIDFLRAVPSQPLVGIGKVDRRTRRVYYCSAELRDEQRRVVFTVGRCVQIVLDAGRGDSEG